MDPLQVDDPCTAAKDARVNPHGPVALSVEQANPVLVQPQ